MNKLKFYEEEAKKNETEFSTITEELKNHNEAVHILTFQEQTLNKVYIKNTAQVEFYKRTHEFVSTMNIKPVVTSAKILKLLLDILLDQSVQFLEQFFIFLKHSLCFRNSNRLFLNATPYADKFANFINNLSFIIKSFELPETLNGDMYVHTFMICKEIIENIPHELEVDLLEIVTHVHSYV
jgi:hypothetical protein